MLLKGESRYSLVSALLASKTSLDFGDSDVATAKTQLVTLINDGEPSAPGINVTGFTFSGRQ